ncbi:hypothetical protein BH10PSE4_BH10PSE4_38690 [soil metagenome]
MANSWAVWGGAALAIIALTVAAPALAETCRGPAPAVGQMVSGPVMHVLDGRTLCVAQGPTPDQWIPLRISSSVALMADDREKLMATAFAQSLRCEVTGGRGATRTAACTLEGRPLDSLLADPAVVTLAKAWR